MRIVLLTYGTRGDVQPFVALGVGLKAAGFDVVLAAPDRFQPFAADYGLEFVGLPGDPGELAQRLSDDGGQSFWNVAREIRDYALPLGVPVFQAMQAACAGVDAIVYSFLLAVPAHHIATEQGVPGFFVQLQPVMTPTADFPSLMFPTSPVLRGFLNRLTHQLFVQIFWQANRFSYQTVRRRNRDAGLPRRVTWPLAADDPQRPTVLYAISPALVPVPADWPADAIMTGAWFLDAPTGWQPDPTLVDFLRDGPLPVVIGFGSMRSARMAHTVEMALDALDRIGQRGLLLTGWSGISQADLPQDVLKVDHAPHDWLLPRVAAVLHHGGAGTTHAVLRAGVPMVVTPFFGDQGFWADQVHRLDLSPAPLDRAHLDPDALALALHVAATYPPLRERTRQAGRIVRAEGGVTNAVRVIRRRLDAPQR